MEFGLGVLTGVGLWPALIFAAWVILLFPLVEFERTGFAVLSVIVGLALAQFGFGYDVLGTITGNPIAILAWGGFYILVGIGYSLLRWNSFCAKWRREYDAEPGGFTRSTMWSNRPDAATSKNRITAWMMFWPWSAFWWLLSDVITEIFEWIYVRFAAVYSRIAARHLDGLAPPPK